MPPAARVTDMHTCPMVTGIVPHVGGPILPPGHPTTLIGFLPAARVGDMVTCVGPPDTIVKGSPTVMIGNMPAARGCGKGGGAELPDDLKPKLVEALFDHRPDEWYHPEGKAIPPQREEASKDARDLLREIGEQALKKVKLSDELKERVETVLEEISQGKP